MSPEAAMLERPYRPLARSHTASRAGRWSVRLGDRTRGGDPGRPDRPPSTAGAERHLATDDLPVRLVFAPRGKP